MPRCTHYACRCARAEELAAMSDRAADPRTAALLLAEAMAVHSLKVPCRVGPPDEDDSDRDRSGDDWWTDR